MIYAKVCKFCGTTDFEEIVTLDSNFQIVKCKGCRLARTVPEPLMSYDENSDYVDTYLNNEELFRSFFRPVVKFIRKHQPKGKLLDIGCSTGFLLEEAAKYGFEAEGIELNNKAASYCINKGMIIKNCALQECHYQDTTFDVVVMSHVLEHITDLNSFLREVHRIIVPSGFLVLSQPSYKGIIARLLKQNWYGWVPKDHVWHFTPETVSMVLQQNGFKVKDIQVNTMYYPLEPNIKGLLKALIARISGKVGCGDQFYVVAQKL